jgi:chromosome segregation ATPase
MPKPYKCEICGETDPSKFYKNRKGLCKIHFAEYVNESKCEKEKQKINAQIDELDGLDNELSKNYKWIKDIEAKLDSYCDDFNEFYEDFDEMVESKTVDLKKDIDVIFLNEKSFQKDVDFLTKRNNQLESQVKDLTKENEEMKKDIDLLNEQMVQVFEYMKQMNEYITQMDKTETSVGFDIPEEKPVLGSAKKKGFNSEEDIIFQKNRLNGMNAGELRTLAEQLRIKTSKPTGGYKAVGDLRDEIRQKLNSWMNVK